MTWTHNAAGIALVCNGTNHELQVIPVLQTAVTDGDALGATQRVWQVAARLGWTATPTEHRCPSCTLRAQPPNPTLDY